MLHSIWTYSISELGDSRLSVLSLPTTMEVKERRETHELDMRTNLGINHKRCSSQVTASCVREKPRALASMVPSIVVKDGRCTNLNHPNPTTMIEESDVSSHFAYSQ